MQKRIKWYRTKLDKDALAELTKRSDLKGLAHMVPFVLIVLASGATALYLFFNAPLWTFLVMLFVHCTLFKFFGRVSASHELCHQTVFKSRWLNRLFYSVFTFFAWENAVYLKARHMSHHQYTGFNDRDGELQLPMIIPPTKWLALVTFDVREFVEQLRLNLKLSVGRFDFGMTPELFPESDMKARNAATRAAQVLLLGHVALATGFIVSGLWPLLLIVTLAPFTAQWLNMLVAFPQHAGLQPGVTDFRLNSRTNDLGPVLSFLYCNMQHHIEHHMYASVPFYNLPKLRKALEHDLPPSSGGLIATWRQILRAWKVQRKNPDYAIEVELPGRADAQNC
jgi:fatty acid desaturase